jgi:alpha-aminoadipic semialdehyde synthase
MDLSPAQVVIGIKEVPRDLLEGGKSYAFFSHTAKGQSHNLPLLSSMLRSKSRFIDWELLTDEEGKRTTAFGYLAGVAGMAEGLSNFGTKALAMGFATPFLELPRPYMNTSMDMLERSLEGVGKRIEEGGMAKELGSVVVVVSGKGRVGEGARMVLDRVGAVWLDSVKSMKTVVEDPSGFSVFLTEEIEILTMGTNRSRLDEDICLSARAE